MAKQKQDPRTIPPNLRELGATIYATREMLLRHIRNVHRDNETAMKREYEEEYARQLKKLS